MECSNVDVILPQVVALLFYANEYLLTANKHYKWILTWRCRKDMRLKNGKTTSSKWTSLLIPPRAMLQPLQGKSWEKRTSKWWIEPYWELGITAMGEALFILKQAKKPSTLTIYAKAPSAKLPQLHFEMTPQQFRMFRIDWEVFTRMTDMPISQTNI